MMLESTLSASDLPATTMTFKYGYTWVLANQSEAHADACTRYGYEPTSKDVSMTWNQSTCNTVASGLGFNCSRGDFNNSAKAMWYIVLFYHKIIEI